MDFCKIELKDKEIFDKYLTQDNLALSDINFTNCYMWRYAREISFAEVAGNLIIKTQYPNQAPYIFYPIGDGDKRASLDSVLQEFKAQNLNLQIRALNKEQASELGQFYPHAKPVANRDKFDYIYNVSELIALSGRKYHKKKNHLNYFLQEYAHFAYEAIDSSNITQLLAVNNAWFEANPNKSEGLKFENLGINDALNSFEALGLKGGLIRVDSQIIAFSFGEVIPCTLSYEGVSGDMAVMHIEKADSQFRGIFQAINQQVLEHCFAQCAWVNREEDLGIEGLRKAKLSYQPTLLLEKFEVVL
ncbi:DUF2156 domain-containing protein [Helicobacter himalayensis]|uniref:DUF2156 domain-containing protein n=1 Tax=Helicobacter himalayensis TaxID=1591088 RepID=UPI0008363A4D|nr:phosphatidylglycerol lysyltransferase domain-containing protein [Helicobacter himalayensis]